MEWHSIERRREALGKNILILLPDSDNHVKELLKNNHKAVVNLLPTYKHKIILVSNILQSLKKSYIEKYVRYHFPNTNPESIKNKLLNFEYSNAVIRTAKSLGVDQDKLPCICFLEYNSTFRTIPISEKDSLSSLLQQLKEFYNNSLPVDDGIRFKRVRREPEQVTREAEFEREMYNLSKKVIKKLNSFDKADAINLFIETLSKEALKEQPLIVSPLHIDSDFNISLPEYNTSIKLTPLQKTAYFLFLNHPEGIMFCDLPDYKNEMFRIYKAVGSYNLFGKTEERIDQLADPHSNSMSEKISKIRSAFLSSHSERIVEPYLISGERGAPKKIPLERSLVKANDSVPF